MLPPYARYVDQKLAGILAELRKLRELEFAYSDAKEVLSLLEKVFERDQKRILRAAPDVRDTCIQANYDIWSFHPILGFIIRSTNVRNAFEIYDPILRLCKQLLGPDVHLVLSSEWDFSPYTYPMSFAELPGFVLVGLPAAESANALLVPLSGHELGHSAWTALRLEKRFQEQVERHISVAYQDTLQKSRPSGRASAASASAQLDIAALPIIGPAIRLAMRQIQEVYCDALGLRLFGKSFLYSFTYFLAPSIGFSRNPEYPSLKDRVSFLCDACRTFGISPPPDFIDEFEPDYDPRDTLPAERQIIALADGATKTIVPALINVVDEISKEKNLCSPSEVVLKEILIRFRDFVPFEGLAYIGDIVNAGWELYHDDRFWEENEIAEHDRLHTLNDLMLKSAEVSELKTRLGEYDATKRGDDS